MKKNFQRIRGQKLNILHQLWAMVSKFTTLQNRRILNKNCAEKYSPFHMSEMSAHTDGLWTVFRATYFVQILSGGRFRTNIFHDFGFRSTFSHTL